MAAYAAVVSLMYSINQIQNHHRPPIFLDETQVESLTESLNFLQNFLESYSLHFGYSKEANPLEMRIADAAYAAEDVIESHIFDQIHTGSVNRGKRIYPIDLQRVIHEMDSIKEEMMNIKEKKKKVQDPLQRNSRSGSASMGKYPMVGFDDLKVEIMDKLIGENDRRIIPIVGMAGIGKTTLAKNVYQNSIIVRNFDIRGWVTVTREYRNREILALLLKQGGEDLREEDEEDEYELGDKLYQRLWGRRYLIIMDDIWDIKVWEQLRKYFPDNQNGSRIVLTTRISNFHLSDSNYVLKVGFLDKENSWILFSKIVFGEEGCSNLELEEIGREIIVENYRGLPLSIVVVGGLLARSEHTLEYWEYIAENLNSVVNSEDDENCLKLLHISYSELPVYLKPCFLYTGVFSEDRSIRVSELVNLWVAEGFLKPNSGKSWEETAEEYLKELINRNLISVQRLESTGNIKYCSIHDLLRDLCLREAEKESFFSLPQELSYQRRVVIPDNTWRARALEALPFMSLARSLICDSMKILPLHRFRLMRIMSCPQFDYSDRFEDLFKLVNLRYLVLNARWVSHIPSSIHLLWNLRTLIVHIGEESGPFDIWYMSQLRHLEFGKGLYLVDTADGIVLQNLQVVRTVINFKWSDEVIKRIPSIKELKVDYYHDSIENGWRDYCVSNLDRLHNLESLHCQLVGSRTSDILQNLTLLSFPSSLKKLTLNVWHVGWEESTLEKIASFQFDSSVPLCILETRVCSHDMSNKCSLPLLEKLKLIGGSFKGRGWETVEGQFPSLKSLQIERCKDMEFWTTESSHFPCLERLVLVQLRELIEISFEIGEMEALKLIKLVWCSNSAVISTKRIIEEQEELYGEASLQIRVSTWNFEQKQELKSLAVCPNFQFI